MGETLHSRLLEIGGQTWPDYFNLRVIDRVSAPGCQVVSDEAAAVEQAIAVIKAEKSADPFADVFGDQIDREQVRASVLAASRACENRLANWERLQSLNTPGVQAFVLVEAGLSQAVLLVTGNRRVLLGLMLLFCAAAATLGRQHIALRPVESRLDDRVATVSQLVANGLLTASTWLYRQQELAQAEAGMPLAHLFMHDIWVAGFGTLTLISLWQLRRRRDDLPVGRSWSRAMLSVPLYSFMCISASIQFAFHGFYHGIAVYLTMMAELSALFLNLGLYVWVGMLLARTHLPRKVFNVLRPWRLPPKWLGVAVLLLTALPTAYSGASGIFILAAGLTLYRELRRAGTSEQLALATTAISGSMGTMLRPCLLVVIVATLNNSVTTDEMFSAGARVLLLTASVYAIYVFLIGGPSKGKIAPLRVAVPGMLRALVPLLPYVAIFAGVILLWNLLLNRGLDEFSAPAILPLFEMGYLTPPVALNHLLTRQVVGVPTSPESLYGTFWQRNFRFILPVLVMGTTLMMVTYLPAFGSTIFQLLLGIQSPA